MLYEPRRRRMLPLIWARIAHAYRVTRSRLTAWNRRRRLEGSISHLPPYLLYDIGITPDEIGRRKYRAPRPSHDRQQH